NSQNGFSVKSVQAMIAAKHAHWRAKDSWMSRLSKDDIHRMLGLREVPVGTLNYESLHPLDLPPSVDWRSHNGTDWLGAVMNQGNCGSCVAFATVATLEAQYSIASGLPWLH